MAFNAQGIWTPEDDTVSSRVTGLLKTDNPLMDVARTSGMQYANKRGLLNSSIAAGAAQKAAIDVALPIASQEASQVAQKNLAGMQIGSQEKIAQMNVAAHDREKATAAVTAMENVYGEAFRTIAQAHELPQTARTKYLEHLSTLRDSNINLVEQLYGIDLEWATPNDLWASTDVPRPAGLPLPGATPVP